MGLKRIYVICMMVSLMATSCIRDKSPLGIFIYENLTEYDVVLEKWKDDNCVPINIPINESFSFSEDGDIGDLPWPFYRQYLDSIRLVFNSERKVIYLNILSDTENKNIFNRYFYEKKKIWDYKYELYYPIDEYHIEISEPYEPEE